MKPKLTQRQLHARFLVLSKRANDEAQRVAKLMNEIASLHATSGYSLPNQAMWGQLYHLAADASARDYLYRAANTLSALGNQALVTGKAG